MMCVGLTFRCSTIILFGICSGVFDMFVQRTQKGLFGAIATRPTTTYNVL